MTKYILPLCFVLGLMGCATSGRVVTMSLHTMFPDDSRVRALAEAAEAGRVSEVDKLVAQGVDVNARGTSNATLLFWALNGSSRNGISVRSRNSTKGFERLLQLGADPNVVYDDGQTLIHRAVHHKDSDYLKLALEYGGNPNLVAGSQKKTPLFEAMRPGNKDKIPILLAAGADMDFQSRSGETPMMVAARQYQFDTVHYLLERGADYQIKNYYADSTLASYFGFNRRVRDPESDLALWMKKVVDWLETRGVEIPESDW